MIRDLDISDLLKIERVHSRDFPLPKIHDKSYISQKTILNGDEVVGAIFGRLTSEVSLILSENLPKITRARLWQEAVRAIVEDLLSKNIKSTHVFVTPSSDEHYAQLLESKMGFVRATGIPLYLEVK